MRRRRGRRAPASTPAWSSTPVTPTALRLAPPLLVSDDEIDEAVAILAGALERAAPPA